MDKFHRHYFDPKKPNTNTVKSMVIEIRSVFAWGRKYISNPKGHM